MLKSDSIAQLAAALCVAQGAVQGARKDSTNPHLRSSYADLSSVWNACRAALSSNGLSVVQMPCDAGEGRVGLTTLLMHSSGEYLSETVSVALAKQDAQSLGSALTYARRYSLASFVGIAPEDDDGEAATRPTQNSAPRAEVSPRNSVTPPSSTPRSGNLTSEQAGRLHKKLGAIGIKDHPAYASEVLKRPITSLTDINGPEGVRLLEQAQIDRDALEAENAAAAFAEIEN